MPTLYLSPGSSSMATHIALNEIGAPFELSWLSFANKEQRAPPFAALNPEAKVPTLVDGELILTEVAATLYYLARKHPQADLWPAGDLAAEATAISWMSFTASTLHPARGKGGDVARTAFGHAERRLGGRTFAVGAGGGRYSIADIHLFRLYWRLRGSMPEAASLFPSLEAHYARMLARPAVAKTIATESAVGYELPA